MCVYMGKRVNGIRCTFLYIVLVLLAVSVGLNVHYCTTNAERDITTHSDTVTVFDTARWFMPAFKDMRIVRYDTVRFPLVLTSIDRKGNGDVRADSTQIKDSFADSRFTPVVDRDSATVQIPITQKIYKTEQYRAYVSGYNPRLDSIEVYNKIATITNVIKKKPPGRFGIGIIGGYGVGNNGLTPFIGIGIQYKLLSL